MSDEDLEYDNWISVLGTAVKLHYTSIASVKIMNYVTFTN